MPPYGARKRKDLGPLWEFFPEGALEHDPYAYLKSLGPVAREPALAASG